MRPLCERLPAFLGAALLGGTLLLGCGPGVEGEPAASCFTHPERCPDVDGGTPPSAARSTAATGFGFANPPDAPPLPPAGGLCPEGLLACGDLCVDPEVDPIHCGGCGVTCLAAQQCRFGQCCALDDTLCDGVCTDVMRDPFNCGTCGFACDFGSECSLGACTPEDPFGP